MTSLVLEKEPIVVNVSLSSRHLAIELADARHVLIPLEWYPRLMNASKAERRNWSLPGHGYAIEWPDLDEHIGVESLLAGNQSGESARSLKSLAGVPSKAKKDNKGSEKKGQISDDVPRNHRRPRIRVRLTDQKQKRRCHRPVRGRRAGRPRRCRQSAARSSAAQIRHAQLRQRRRLPRNRSEEGAQGRLRAAPRSRVSPVKLRATSTASS